MKILQKKDQNSLDTAGTFTPAQRLRVDLVPPLVCSRPDGKPYERSASVEAEIHTTLSLPQSGWAAKAKHLQNETLVFLIRYTHDGDEELCGLLMRELHRRITARVGFFVQGLDSLAKEEIVLNVEMEILEAVLTKEATRKTDFLEIAFAQKVEQVTVDAIRKFDNSPLAYRGEVIADPVDEEGEEIERPIEMVGDDEAPSPENTLLNLEDENRRHQLLRKACEAVTDRKHLEAVILHYAWLAGHIQIPEETHSDASLPRNSKADQIPACHRSSRNARRPRNTSRQELVC